MNGDMTVAEHRARAIALLDRADEVEKGPRCHLAKTYATMALAHAELAKTAPDVAVAAATESTTPLYERNYPDNVLWGTQAFHNLGDISRDSGDYFAVTGETQHNYLGSWLTGMGYVDVRFPKHTTRPLEPTERDYLADRQVVIA